MKGYSSVAIRAGAELVYKSQGSLLEICWYILASTLVLRVRSWISQNNMLLSKVICCCLGVFSVAAYHSRIFSQDAEVKPADSDGQTENARSLFNLKTPTLGGTQVWTDHVWRRAWRVQQNSLTGHWRLIDDHNIRQAWGTRAACQQELDKQVPDGNLDTQRVVILMHGLMRTSNSMSGLGAEIRKAHPFTTIALEYASTRASITEHAAALREVIEGLPSQVDISFIGHSMGNIVVRHAIGDWLRMEDAETLRRVKQVIMLGPPNQGASIARQLSKVGLFEFLTGPGGMELGAGWNEFASRLATPHCPFGIVAGNLPPSLLANPLVDGQGDFVVSVEETRLPGEADFLEVPRLHSFLMDDPVVQKAVIKFLDHNSFR